MSLKKQIEAAAERVLPRLIALDLLERPERLKIVKYWGARTEHSTEAEILRWYVKELERDKSAGVWPVEQWIHETMRGAGAPAGWVAGKTAPPIRWENPARRVHHGYVEGRLRFRVEPHHLFPKQIILFAGTGSEEVDDTAHGKRRAETILREEYEK